MTPLTIGLPVYNGAQYLERALDALLGQTFGDFRLLVSDNASTDETPAILERYARRDDRVEVVRQPNNRGGAYNFDFVIRSARTEFFMWAAHDDVFGPTAVERCLAVLRDDSSAALCCADLAFMYEDGDPVGTAPNLDTAGMDRESGVSALLRRFNWYAIYGVGRREAMLAKMPGTGRYGADVVWTFELLLHHRVRCVPEVLFSYRIPRGRGYTAQEQQLVINHDVPVVARPYTAMIADMVARTKRSSLAPDEIGGVVRTILRTVAFENSTLLGCIAQENPELSRHDDSLVTYRELRAILDVDVETWPI